MSGVLNWLKSNVATVIFFLVMIAALVALPIVAKNLNESVRQTVKERVNKHAELRKLEKTSITIPQTRGAPISETTLVNQKLLDRYRAVVEAQREDADRVREAAVTHNRKGRGVIIPRLFPEPPVAEREVLPMRFHEELLAAYDGLLADIEAGSPPAPETMVELLERRRARFYSQVLQKSLTDPLDPEEQQKLNDELSKARMSRYAEEAERIRLYVSDDALPIPAWQQTQIPTMAELFERQWQYWIVDDVLHGLAQANQPGGSVQREPLKRILQIAVYPAEYAETSSSGGGGVPGFGRTGGGGGGGGGGGTAVPPNPAMEVKPDFSVSITGRRSNPLYDVRLVQVRAIVETARLNEVLDGLARWNFMTVLDLSMYPADHYEGASAGYFYGSEPVSEITLIVETVWLREWTSAFMPVSVKEALGIPVAPAPAG